MSAPTVVSVSPANNDTDVILGTQITVTFDQPIDPATVSDRRRHGRNLQARLGLRVLPPTKVSRARAREGPRLIRLVSHQNHRVAGCCRWPGSAAGSMALVFVLVLRLLLLPAS